MLWRGSVRDFAARIDLTSFKYPEIAIIYSYLAVESWLSWDVATLDRLFASSLTKADQEIQSPSGRHAQAHMKLCARLMVHRLKNPNQYLFRNQTQTLYVIGDSHSLCLSGLPVVWNSKIAIFQGLPIRGIKMFHLGSGISKKYREYFRARIKTVTTNSEIILSIGEIDSRPNEGVFIEAFKTGLANPKGFEKIALATVTNFIKFVSEELAQSGLLKKQVALMGLPPIGYSIKRGLPEGASVKQFVDVNARINLLMREGALAAGWKFIDLQEGSMKLTTQELASFRLDDFHMTPSFYQNVDAWTVRPNI